ncbi:MAG TPA: hypothetical protein VFJ19_20225 [Nocardioidaceae bacterium]|nr:hypothetical protein [Nocardioidaceae bacterium]
MQPEDAVARRTTMSTHGKTHESTDSMTRRWLAPIAASVAVLALFVGLWWAGTTSTASRQAAQHAQGGQLGQDHRGDTTSLSVDAGRGEAEDGSGTPPLAGGGPVAVPDPTSSPPLPKRVVITGYRTTGRTLSLDYTIGIASCYGRIAPPKVAGTAHAVIVTLHRVPAAHSGDTACPDIALLETVDVTLAEPLGDRVVKDGSTGATVPRLPVG